MSARRSSHDGGRPVRRQKSSTTAVVIPFPVSGRQRLIADRAYELMRRRGVVTKQALAAERSAYAAALVRAGVPHAAAAAEGEAFELEMRGIIADVHRALAADLENSVVTEPSHVA